MTPKSQANIKVQSHMYNFNEDIHKFFSKFSILNLCSEMSFSFEEAIYG